MNMSGAPLAPAAAAGGDVPARLADVKAASKENHGARVGMAALLLTTGVSLMASASMALYMYSRYKKLQILTSQPQVAPSGASFPARPFSKTVKALLTTSLYAHSAVLALGVACTLVGILQTSRHAPTHPSHMWKVYSKAGLHETKAAKALLLTGGSLLAVSSGVSIALYKMLREHMAQGRTIAQDFPVESEFSLLPSAAVEADLYRAQIALAALSGVVVITAGVSMAGKHMGKMARSIGEGQRKLYSALSDSA